MIEQIKDWFNENRIVIITFLVMGVVFYFLFSYIDATSGDKIRAYMDTPITEMNFGHLIVLIVFYSFIRSK